MTEVNPASTQADRAAGAIMGAFIGDALGLGPHWYYDLDELQRDFGPWISDYTEPKPGRYHSGMKAGELSQTGIIMKLLLQSIAARGTYDESDFCRHLDRELLPQLDGTPSHGPGGYTNHSFRQVYQHRVVEKRDWGQTGGNADTSEAAERLAILGAFYASEPSALGRAALSNCRLSQTDSLVAQQSVAFSLVVGALVRGEPFDDNLSDTLMDELESGEVPFVAGSSTAASGSLESTLGFASPDALLLPSWIATTVLDPDLRVEPPYKISLTYGMSCAVNFVLPAAYYLAALFPNDFESAVLHAINGGGQNMSRACLTGALVGAQVGLSGIPRRFLKGLADSEELLQLTRRATGLA